MKLSVPSYYSNKPKLKRKLKMNNPELKNFPHSVNGMTKLTDVAVIACNLTWTLILIIATKEYQIHHSNRILNADTLHWNHTDWLDMLREWKHLTGGE